MRSVGNLDWRVALAGSGERQYADALRQRAATLEIDDRVMFLGQRTDSATLALAADIGILISHQEGSSNAVLEYMAARLPVIATAVGSNLDAVEHGANGIRAPVRNPDAVAGALNGLTAHTRQNRPRDGQGKEGS